jgi:hypothetical protein
VLKFAVPLQYATSAQFPTAPLHALSSAVSCHCRGHTLHNNREQVRPLDTHHGSVTVAQRPVTHTSTSCSCQLCSPMQCSKQSMAIAEIGSQMATALPVMSCAALACQVAMHTSQLANMPCTSTSPQPLDTLVWASTLMYLQE